MIVFLWWSYTTCNLQPCWQAHNSKFAIIGTMNENTFFHSIMMTLGGIDHTQCKYIFYTCNTDFIIWNSQKLWVSLISIVQTKENKHYTSYLEHFFKVFVRPYYHDYTLFNFSYKNKKVLLCHIKQFNYLFEKKLQLNRKTWLHWMRFLIG